MELEQQMSINVETTTLDTESARHGFPDYIKVDVEGSELQVLHGAESALRVKRPVMFVELHSNEIEKEYYAYMNARNYRTVPIDGTGYPRAVVSTPLD